MKYNRIKWYGDHLLFGFYRVQKEMVVENKRNNIDRVLLGFRVFQVSKRSGGEPKERKNKITE